MATIKLKTPLSQKDILNLKVGDEVLISGTIFSARDKAHEYFVKNNFNRIKGGILYHCGPLISGKQILAAGPTTSYRMNYYTPTVIEKYGIKAIIGKGGMDDSVKKALKGKAVYLSAMGGAAVLYAERLKTKKVYKKEFGQTDAIWELSAKDFPAIVTIDSFGNSLHDEIYEKSKEIFLKLINKDAEPKKRNTKAA